MVDRTSRGGSYDDVGAPMWVERQRCDEGDVGTPPLYPDDVGKLVALR